jgi:hypothetical protein
MQPLDDPIFPAPTEPSDSAIVDKPLLTAQASVPSPAPHEPRLAASPLANSSTDLIAFDDDHLPVVPKVTVRHHSSVHVNHHLD